MGRLLSPIVFFMVCTVQFAAASAPVDSVPDEDRQRRQAFAWMDTLGFPDMKNARFVRVRIYSPNEVETISTGFLFEEKGHRFKVLQLDLEISSHERTPPDTISGGRLDYEPYDLEPYVRTWIAGMQQQARSHAPEAALLLAWACARQGLDDAAVQLFRAAGSGDGTLQERAARRMASLEMTRAYNAFVDHTVSRAELLKKYERIARHFPMAESSHVMACEIAMQLRVMVEEDLAHAELMRQRAPFAKLGAREQIAELVFQLRDQQLYLRERSAVLQLVDPKSAGRQLVEKGLAAVPQLIAALDDKRFARSWSSSMPYTVADCAAVILRDISGFSPEQSVYPQLLPRQDREPGTLALARAVYTAWYGDVRKKGEKRWFVDAVGRSDRNSLEQARRFADRFGAEAVPELAAAARSDPRIRPDLVEIIRQIPGEKTTAFLLAELNEGPFDCQMTAAQELFERGRPEALAAIIAEWHDATPRLRLTTQANRLGRRDHSQIIRFLVDSGKREAIAALAVNLDKRPVSQRVEVIRALKDLPAAGGDLDKLKEAAEALLVRCLDDMEENRGWSFQVNAHQFVSPRVCDVAGNTLSELLPEKYRFDVAAVPAWRNRQLVEIKNLWRRAKGLPSLPAPRQRTTAAAPAKLIRPHLETLLVDPAFLADPDAHGRAWKEIEKHGPRAFWAVLDFRDHTTNKIDFDLADALAKKLSCTVVDVEFADSLQPDRLAGVCGRSGMALTGVAGWFGNGLSVAAGLHGGNAASPFENLKNKPLDARSFMSAVEAALRELPDDAHGLQVAAVRSGDGTGITLVVELLNRQQAASKNLATAARTYYTTAVPANPPAPVQFAPVPAQFPGAFPAGPLPPPGAGPPPLPVVVKPAKILSERPAASVDGTADEAEKAKAVARANAGKNRSDPAARFRFRNQVRLGTEKVGGGDNQVVVMVGGQWTVQRSNVSFPIIHTSVGDHFASLPWWEPSLETALNQCLASAPGEPVEISVCFVRN